MIQRKIKREVKLEAKLSNRAQKLSSLNSFDPGIFKFENTSVSELLDQYKNGNPSLLSKSVYLFPKSTINRYSLRNFINTPPLYSVTSLPSDNEGTESEVTQNSQESQPFQLMQIKPIFKIDRNAKASQPSISQLPKRSRGRPPKNRPPIEYSLSNPTSQTSSDPSSSHQYPNISVLQQKFTVQILCQKFKEYNSLSLSSRLSLVKKQAARIDRENGRHCSVCLEEGISLTNDLPTSAIQVLKYTLLKCRQCEVLVHPQCLKNYRPQKLTRSQAQAWKCPSCTLQILKAINDPKCVFCAKTPASEQRTASELWCRDSVGNYWHYFCEIWGSVERLREQQSTSLKCDICGDNAGQLTRCVRKGCQSKFHAMCAKRAGWLVQANELQRHAIMHIFCERHSIPFYFLRQQIG